MQRDGVNDVDPKGASAATSQLHPSAVGAQPVLLRNEIGRVVDRGGPFTENRAAVPVRIVLERTASVPRDLVDVTDG